jgi:transposase-like protein
MSEVKSSLTPISGKSHRYSEDFKRSAVHLVTDEQYTFKAAAQAVGVSDKSLYEWHKKFASVAHPQFMYQRGKAACLLE